MFKDKNLVHDMGQTQESGGVKSIHFIQIFLFDIQISSMNKQTIKKTDRIAATQKARYTMF
jgi:hypothetical protein